MSTPVQQPTPTPEVTRKWYSGIEIPKEKWDAIDRFLAQRGWMSLNRETSVVEIAESEGMIVGISCLQLAPMAGPMLVRPQFRGTGLAQQMAQDTVDKLIELGARGWIVIADSPHTEKMCKDLGHVKLESPLYITPGGE